MQVTNNFCNCCGGDFDETGVWMHDNKPVCFICWCNLNNIDDNIFNDDNSDDTRINVSDISEEDWNDLSEDYRDDLSLMDSIDKDELDVMLSVSRRTK